MAVEVKKTKSPRHCIMNTSGGKITVQFNITNGLSAGSKFLVFNIDQREKIENWEMSSSATRHEIESSPSSLEGKAMKWVIRVCSLHPNIDSGDIEVLLFQDGVTLQMTKRIFYNQTEVPQCTADEANEVEDFLVFSKQISIT